jgi:hypothetical protein
VIGYLEGYIHDLWHSDWRKSCTDYGGSSKMEPAAKVKENWAEDHPWTEACEEALMAAALVATLVEHRHHVQQKTAHPRSEGVGPNWRMVARLQQLGE